MPSPQRLCLQHRPGKAFWHRSQETVVAVFGLKMTGQTMYGNHAYGQLVHVIGLGAKAGHHSHIACLHQASTPEILADVSCRLFLLLGFCLVLYLLSLYKKPASLSLLSKRLALTDCGRSRSLPALHALQYPRERCHQSVSSTQLALLPGKT